MRLYETECQNRKEFETDLLLRGKSHQIFTGPANGKTWVALWFIKRAIERKQTVVFLDMENGRRIVAERLQELAVGDAVDEHLHYFDYPSLDISHEATSEYEALLDELKPDLVIFDSWVGFLAACGLDENSSTNVEEWANACVHPAKAKDCTVVILDHVPHDANRSREPHAKRIW